MTTSTSAPIPLTTVYTLPTSCATQWIEFGLNTIYRDEIHATFGAYGANCWPPSYDAAKYSFYSPGVCPDQWTVATVTTANSQSGQFSAHCCPSGYTFNSLCQSSLPPTTTHAYKYAAITTTKIQNSTSTSTKFGLNPTTPIAYALSTGGMAKIDGVPIQWASTDLTQLPTAAAAQLAAVMTAFSSSPVATISSSAATSSAINTSSAGSKGGNTLGVGAKAGIGAGIGVFVFLLIGAIILYYLRFRRSKPVPTPVPVDTKPVSPVIELEGDSAFPSELPSTLPQLSWVDGEKAPRVLSGHFWIETPETPAGAGIKEAEDFN